MTIEDKQKLKCYNLLKEHIKGLILIAIPKSIECKVVTAIQKTIDLYEEVFLNER